MSQQLQVALLRALLSAGLAAGIAFVSAVQVPGASFRVAGFAAAGAFLSVLASRGLAEGLIDQQQAQTLQGPPNIGRPPPGA